MKVLRVVFLQDSVVLKKEFSRHRLWQHDIFQSDEYRDFERNLTGVMQAERDLTELSLERAMPDLMEHLKASG